MNNQDALACGDLCHSVSRNGREALALIVNAMNVLARSGVVVVDSEITIRLAHRWQSHKIATALTPRLVKLPYRTACIQNEQGRELFGKALAIAECCGAGEAVLVHARSVSRKRPYLFR